MKKISVLIFVGVVTSSYSFGALIPRAVQPMTRYYCSRATPPKLPSLFAMVAGGLGGTLASTNLLALGVRSYPHLDPSNADDRDTILLAFNLSTPVGMYSGLRIVGLPRSPAAAAAFTGLIILDMAFAMRKNSDRK